MAGQNVVFKQGDDTTGDSGERGNAITPGGGFQSIKPYADGEQVFASVLNRSIENTRKRTEVLRTSIEDSLYRLDANMRYFITGGSADGTGGVVPYVQNWAEDTPGRYIFELTAPIVIQPLNTPKNDVQEEAIYTFTNPLLGTLNLTCTLRSYTGANLIKVIWLDVPPSELSGAIEPNYCDAFVTGDPAHILTITVRNDGQTTLGNVSAALTSLGTTLTDIGITHSTTGSTAPVIELSSWDASNPSQDYQLAGTFERVVHYLQATTVATFFSTNSGLSDGDTLAIQYVDVDARRKQHIGNTDPDPTTVTESMLFITTENAERIPNAIPLCKRIGEYLYWIDGTVIVDAQAIMFGEHGNTVNRMISGGIVYSNYTPSSPESSDVLAISGSPSLQEQMETTVDSVNRRASLVTNEEIDSVRWIMTMPTASPIPESSYAHDYRFAAYTVLGGSGLYPSNWYKNIGSLVQFYPATQIGKVAAGYFEMDTSYANTIQEVNAIKSYSIIAGNVEPTNDIHVNEFIADAYNIGNTNMYSVYAALQTGNVSATFITAGAAIKAYVDVDSTSMNAAVSAIELDFNINSPNSGTTSGVNNIFTASDNCRYQYGVNTNMNSSTNSSFEVHGTHNIVALNSGSAVSQEAAAFYGRVSANSGGVTDKSIGVYIDSNVYGEITSWYVGNYIELSTATFSTVTERFVGNYIEMSNVITTHSDRPWGMCGVYLSLETTPLRSFSVPETDIPARLYAFKADMIVLAGSGDHRQHTRLIDIDFSVEESETVIFDNDLYGCDIRIGTSTGSAIDMQSSDAIYGYNIDIDDGITNCSEMYFFTGTCLGIGGTNNSVYGPKSIFTLYDDNSQHNAQLLFRKSDVSNAPINGRLGTIGWGGKISNFVGDWDDYGASVYAVMTGYSLSNYTSADLYLSAPHGKIELAAEDGSVIVEPYSSSEGCRLNASACSFVQIPVDTDTTGMSGLQAGDMYCTLPSGSGGNVVLHIYTGSGWREVTLTP